MLPFFLDTRRFRAMRILTLLFVAMLAPGGQLVAEDARPNVVLILSDDQGWPDYGFMGHDTIETPHLDQLAARSVVFRRGYVPSPLCRPSLASIVTGLYPHQHGVCSNDVDPSRRAESDAPVRAQFHKHPSLVRRLVDSGYLAFQSGKWWEGSYRDGGFTDGMTLGDPARGGRHGDRGLAIGRRGMKPITDFIDEAVERSRPFFVWYAPFLPHTPHTPPRGLLDKYTTPGRPANVAKYYAMCDWFDQTCGTLIDHLDAAGAAENTLVLYACDNGWAPVDPAADNPPGWWNDYAPRSKGSPFERGVRTPIMISWPGRVEPADSPDLATTLDLMPTTLKACGLQPPAGLPGLDLLDPDARASRDAVFGGAWSIHNSTPGDPMATLQYRWCVGKRWKLLVRHRGTDTTRYRTVHEWDREAIRLYDMAADPNEQDNQAGAFPGTVRELTAKIDAVLPMPE
ncbi:MAG: sulfatase-like hydrolase/transferase [Planctomycetota bacterium]